MSTEQSYKISTWFTDQLSCAESEADASKIGEAAMSTVKKRLEEKPDWAPDANTTIDG